MLFLLDIGGTNTRFAISEDHQSFSEPEKWSTSMDFTEALTTIKDKITPHLDTLPKATIIAVPGTVTDQKNITGGPNLSSWNNQPLAEEIMKITSAPVHIVNDADLGGLGEATAGAGQDYAIVAFLTISTGVGGTRIVDNRIDTKAIGFEPGHQIIDASGTLCLDCNQPATLEHLIGGASTQKRYNKPPQEITDPKIWEAHARHLAFGLQNVMAMWSPHCIIIGGPMMNQIDIKQVITSLEKNITTKHPIPPIFTGTLGDNRNLHGALAYAKQHK